MDKIISKELLTLILGVTVVDTQYGAVWIDTEDYVRFQYTTPEAGSMWKEKPIHKDTLCRVLLDFIVKQGFIVEIWEDEECVDVEVRHKAIEDCSDGISFSYERPREQRIDAIAKATEWAAKEKGLL